jgi:radical SAM protein with 4Fe4S-binding SPASM domain
MSDSEKSRTAVSFLPATAVLELTYRCNHQCIFCSCPWERAGSSFDKREELTTEQWKSTISMLCEMGVTNIAFTGGEPLLRPDISDLIQHAALQTTEHIETINGQLKSQIAPPKLYLLSNGYLIDDAVIDLCRKHHVQLSISLPGLDSFTEHTAVANVDGVLKCFKVAKEADLHTVANITVTKRNLHELGKTMSAALLAGADQILINRFIPGGRGLEHADQLSLSAGDVGTMLSVAEDVLRNAKRLGSLGTEIPKCIVDTSSFKHMEASTRCAAAIDFFVIGPSGYIRVCNHSQERLSHIDRVSELKMNDYWRTFTQKRYLPEVCMECHDRNVCDGGCREAAHIVGGTLCSPDVVLMDKYRIEYPGDDPVDRPSS